ncbi:MAG: 1-acyl-sn-glycerol-3-phosphate acyltransferase [Clostridiales bacterium]|nr:1-acyl-sn-glycerol-3-phosphate acyltransferase [Candidatus Equinaster intestinalis]
MNALYRFVRVLCIALVKIGFKVEVSGRCELENGVNVMLCCNHQSFWDMPILIANSPYKINFMGKKELFKNKLFTKVLRTLGVIPVNRGAADLAAIKMSGEALKSGVLGIFPEGTRRPLEKPEQAKSGAAMLALQSKAKILPAAINYNGRIKLFGKVNLNFAEPIDSSEYLPQEQKKALPKTAIRNLSNDISETIIKLWEK